MYPHYRSHRGIPYGDSFLFLSKLDASIINLSSAEAMSEAPPEVQKVIRDNSNYHRFLGESRGDREVIEKCRAFFLRHGIECKPENVSLTSGVINGIFEAIEIIRKHGQRVAVVTPTFGYYFTKFEEKGIPFTTIPTTKEQNFLLDPMDFEECLKADPSIKILLLCYPNNPTGANLSKENASKIAEIARKYGIFIIQDAIFLENKLFAKDCGSAIASEAIEDSLTFFGVSKMMGVAAQSGICVGSKQYIPIFKRLGGYSVVEQKIISAALEDNEENRSYLEENRQKYLLNIRAVKEKIEELNKKFCEALGDQEKPYVKPYLDSPEAGNVYLLDFSGLCDKIHEGVPMRSGLDVAEWLLDKASVGVVPGECYLFEPKEMLVRMSLGHEPHLLISAFDAMIAATENIFNPPSKTTSPTDLKKMMSDIKARL